MKTYKIREITDKETGLILAYLVNGENVCIAVPAYYVLDKESYPMATKIRGDWEDVKIECQEGWQSGNNGKRAVLGVENRKRAVLFALWFTVRKAARDITQR